MGFPEKTADSFELPLRRGEGGEWINFDGFSDESRRIFERIAHI